MYDLAPYDKWWHWYTVEEDERSPFYDLDRGDEDYSLQIYNYYISNLWDEIGSRTLYVKVLFVDYEDGYAIIELIGEWNDAIENNIMQLKRSLIDSMIQSGIFKYVLIGENILNFHSSDDSYYEEWAEDIEEEGGYIILLNAPAHTEREMRAANLDQYFFFMEYPQWRIHDPMPFFQMLEDKMLKRLQ